MLDESTFESNRTVLIDAAGNKILLCASVPTRSDSVVRLAQSLKQPIDMIAVTWPNERTKDSNYVLFWNPDGSSETFCGNACRSIGSLMSKPIELICPSGTVVAGGDSNSGWFQVPKVAPVVVATVNSKPVFLVNPGTPHIVYQDHQSLKLAPILKELSSIYNASVTRIIEACENKLLVETNERGVGITESCGSGALSASLVAEALAFHETSPAAFQVEFTSGQLLNVKLNDAHSIVHGPIVRGVSKRLETSHFQSVLDLQQLNNGVDVIDTNCPATLSAV